MIPERLGHYRVLQKLGAGGMGEVYLAEDTKLGRKVALKILPAETARNPERLARFQREAKTVAALNHPNIVTIYSVEELDGVHFLTMERVDGNPLSSLLRREGLTLAEILDLGLPLVEAISAAHEHGITHRDLKPDNVMVTSQGRVKVLDFGLAKSAGLGGDGSDTSETSVEVATQEGQILGTVAYMSPEQAEGKMVDPRSDIFSIGILLYEMASGFQPFRGESKLSILSSILRDDPRPISEVRRDLPPDLGRIVARCLEKDRLRRYQSARDLFNDLEALGLECSVSGALSISRGDSDSRADVADPGDRPADSDSRVEGDPSGSDRVSGGSSTSDPDAAETSGVGARFRRANLVRVAVAFAAASILALEVMRQLVHHLGLPDWVVPGALALLLVGLPIVLATAWIQSSRRLSPAADSPRRWFTWRKAIWGGVLAFAVWGLLVTTYVVTRQLGIGPAASLVSSGVLEARDRVLVADVEDDTEGGALGETVQEALAIDLAQSPTVQVVPTQRVGEVLRMMERDPDSPLELPLARELAERDGIKVVVAGRIHSAGVGYVLSARLIAPSTGDILGAYRSNAEGPDALIDAIDELSKRIREGIGESLKTIRANPPLDRVTTPSLEALRKYSLAVKKNDVAGDRDRAIELLKEATALDTTFAMAYRKLGTILSNHSQQPTLARESLSRAYRHRDRLPDRERLLAEASYHMTVTEQTEKAIDAYRQLIELNPMDDWAQNNLGVIYSKAGDREKALACYERANEIAPDALKLGNVIGEQVWLGRDAEAESTLAEFERFYPDNPEVWSDRALFASSRFRYEEAETYVRKYEEQMQGSLFGQARASMGLASLRAIRGRLHEAETYYVEMAERFQKAGSRTSAIELAVNLAALDIFIREQPEAGAGHLDQGLRETPLDSLDVADRPYLELAGLYAVAGRPEDAERLLARFDDQTGPVLTPSDRIERRFAVGMLALAQGHVEEALVAMESVIAEKKTFEGWNLPFLGLAQERAGQPAAAQATYEQYLASPSMFRVIYDRDLLGTVLERLAALYAEAGERERALTTYQRLVDLWAEADPDVQERVAEARRAIARLGSEGRM